MRKIRQVLRLHYESKLSRRQIARSLGLSRDAVANYLTRAAAARIGWPLAEDIDEHALDQRLFPPAATAKTGRKPEPDWARIHQELKRKGATLMVLHTEYLTEYPAGLSYSMFCLRHQEFMETLKRSMRQIHIAGEKVFVDYAGPTLPLTDRVSGFVRQVQIFVGVLGASCYTYAEDICRRVCRIGLPPMYGCSSFSVRYRPGWYAITSNRLSIKPAGGNRL